MPETCSTFGADYSGKRTLPKFLVAQAIEEFEKRAIEWQGCSDGTAAYNEAASYLRAALDDAASSEPT